MSGEVLEIREQVRPAGPSACRCGRAWTACCAAARACSNACCTMASSPSSCGSRRPRPRRFCSERALAAVRPRPTASRGCASRSASMRTCGAFRRRFLRDPLIGRSVRRRPWLRSSRRPEPFEALAWAICEQLIESERAGGDRAPRGGVARAALRSGRGRRRAAGPARAGGARRDGARAARVLRPRRLLARSRSCAQRARWRAGGWTCTAPITSAPGGGCARSPASARGRSRCSRCTARAATTSCPPAGPGPVEARRRARSAEGIRGARADESQVREFFAPYGEWAGLAAAHMLAP